MTAIQCVAAKTTNGCVLEPNGFVGSLSGVLLSLSRSYVQTARHTARRAKALPHADKESGQEMSKGGAPRLSPGPCAKGDYACTLNELPTTVAQKT